MKPAGTHTHDDGSILPALGLVALAVVLATGTASAIAHLLVIIAITIGAVVVLATAGVIAFLVRQSRQEPRRAPIMARPIPRVGVTRPHALSESYRPAISGPRELHLHLYNVAPEDISRIVTTSQGTGPWPRIKED